MGDSYAPSRGANVPDRTPGRNAASAGLTLPVLAALVVVQVLFGTLPIAGKIVLREMDSASLAMLRVSGGALLFLVLHRILVREPIRGVGDALRLAGFSLLGVVANQLLYLKSLILTTATSAQTVSAAGPAMTLLLAIALRKERSGLWKWVGIAVSTAGAAYLIGGAIGLERTGNLYALGNVACFSAYFVLSRDLSRRYDALTVITWTFLFGAVGMLPWGLPPLLHESGTLTGRGTLALVWVILFPTVTTYYLNVWALRRVQASVVSVFVCLQPVTTALLSAPMLGERLPARLVPAALLIFAGVGVTAWGARRTAAAERSVLEEEAVEM